MCPRLSLGSHSDPDTPHSSESCELAGVHRLFIDVEIGSHELIATAAAKAKSEQRKLVIKQAYMENRSRKFVEAGKKMQARPVPIASEGSDRSSTYITDDTKNPWVH